MVVSFVFMQSVQKLKTVLQMYFNDRLFLMLRFDCCFCQFPADIKHIYTLSFQ